MSTPTFSNPPGAAQKHSNLGHYSQSVSLGSGLIKCSDQGGWDPTSGALSPSSSTQIDLAMQNVDIVLRDAGLRGWEDVYLLWSYHVDIQASWEPMVEALKKRIPERRIVWTAVGVKDLAFKGMQIELEVEARKVE